MSMDNQFNRRDFVRFLGAGAAISLAGCAAQPAAPAKMVGRVIVIGGGYGGATAAKYIRMWSGGSVEVFLVERNQQFVSCPLSNLVLGGSRKLGDITLGYGGLREHGVQVLNDEVSAIDADKKLVKFANKYADMKYDKLIVAPGVDFLFDQIPGLNNADAQKQILHAWKAGPETAALRAQLEAMSDGGVYLLSIPKAPYRCPPGPYERACQVASYFKQSKPRSKVIILDANEDVVSKAGLFKAAWKDLYPGIVEYRNNMEIKDVDVKGKALKTDFESITGDVLNVVPPQRAGNIAVAAKLITANNRWCGVDWLSMESLAVKDVHVLGDATLSAFAMPKSASMANNHAKIAAAAIIANLTGQPAPSTTVIANTCYSYVSATEAMHVTSVHRYDTDKKTLLPVQGAGGVSAQRNALEKTYADAWANNIWSDSLG
jgi:sulfite dehydrogenase